MKLSVCCITYNQEKFIQETIEGFLMQKTNFDFDIIISEDCSKDNTVSICIEYQRKYPEKIKLLLNKKNLGAMSNFLQAFDACKGEYIAMCEGDDYWTDPYKLQKQVDFLEANPDYVICFHKIKIDKEGELIDDYITKVPSSVTTLEDLYTTNYIHTPSVVFRNTLKKLPTWFSSAMPGDYALWMLLAKDNGKIKYIDKIMAVYRVHANGMWSSQNPLVKFREQMQITLINVAIEINTNNVKYLEEMLKNLHNSIIHEGYKNVSRLEYAKYWFWLFRKSNMPVNTKIYFLTPQFQVIKQKLKRKLASLSNKTMNR